MTGDVVIGSIFTFGLVVLFVSIFWWVFVLLALVVAALWLAWHALRLLVGWLDARAVEAQAVRDHQQRTARVDDIARQASEQMDEVAAAAARSRP